MGHPWELAAARERAVLRIRAGSRVADRFRAALDEPGRGSQRSTAFTINELRSAWRSPRLDGSNARRFSVAERAVPDNPECRGLPGEPYRCRARLLDHRPYRQHCPLGKRLRGMAAGTVVDLESLLSHESWARRLAAALVGNDDDAADLVQEARIAFWRRPPRDATRVRSWLGTVIRNAVRSRYRAVLRDEARDAQIGATQRGSSSTGDLTHRLEMHRVLATLVAELPEPSREVVLLRYYEGLTRADIGRRLGIPPGTVRWRLKTALDEMRRRLDEVEPGDGSRWRMALAPLAGSVPAVGSPRAMAGAIRWVLGGVGFVAVATAVVAVCVWLRRPYLVHRAGQAHSRITEEKEPPGGSVSTLVEASRRSETLRRGAGNRAMNLPLPRFLVPPSEGISAVAADSKKPRRLDLDFREGNVRNILKLLTRVAATDGVSLVIADDVAGRTTIKRRDTPWDEVLEEVVRSTACGACARGT